MDTSSSRVRLRVAPGARQSALLGRHGEAWKVRIAAAPERGKANAALVQFLASVLDLPRDQIRIVGGHGRRDKLIEVVGQTQAQLELRFTEISEQP